MIVFFNLQEAEKFKGMVDSLQKVLLQRCDKEGKFSLLIVYKKMNFFYTMRSGRHYHLRGTNIVHMAKCTELVRSSKTNKSKSISHLLCFSTLLHYMISLKNSQHFVLQSEVKPKPIVTYYHDFPAS